jgi:protoporphyrinogen/coproporphyrinogen III oxidase
VSTPAPAEHPVIVVGAGISGLVCAYHLQQAGIPALVLEAANRPGGMIATKEAGGFRFELGPQSFLSNEPLFALINALGIKDQLLPADRRAPRYILVRGKLVPAPLAPPSLLTTPLFSGATKWRLFTEMFRASRPPAQDESIAAFVRRKFGDELLERLVAPFVSGVYAGDPEKLSLRASFPKVHEFEEKYGSVLRGAMKSRPAKGALRPGLCSFRDGMATLPRALAAHLGSSIQLQTSVAGLHHGKANGKPWFEMAIERQGHRETLAASAVVVATPTASASQILSGLSDRFAPAFLRIEYAPVAVVSSCYRREQLQRPAEGFGFLVPRSEGLRALGTVFNSSLFPGRAPEGMVCFTSFAGGATDPAICEWSEDKIAQTIGAEIARVLGINGAPVASNVQRYARALPQYNLGHTQVVKSLETQAAALPGLYFAGNYLSGPSIGACVEQALRTAEAVRVYLASIGVAGVGALAHA